MLEEGRTRVRRQATGVDRLMPEYDDGANLSYNGPIEQDPDDERLMDVITAFWDMIILSVNHGDLPGDYPFNQDASRQLAMPKKVFPHEES